MTFDGSTSIFGMLVHLNTIQVKVIGQSSRSQQKFVPFRLQMQSTD